MNQPTDPESEPTPKPWYSSEKIRKNLYLIVSGAVTVVKLLKYDSKLGLGLDAVSLDDLTGTLMLVVVPILAAATALWIGVWGILRRIRDGKDPNHPDAPIATPTAVTATVETVERLTGNVPKPRL